MHKNNLSRLGFDECSKCSYRFIGCPFKYTYYLASSTLKEDMVLNISVDHDIDAPFKINFSKRHDIHHACSGQTVLSPDIYKVVRGVFMERIKKRVREMLNANANHNANIR